MESQSSHQLDQIATATPPAEKLATAGAETSSINSQPEQEFSPKELSLPNIEQYPPKIKKKILAAQAEAQIALTAATMEDTRLLRCTNLIAATERDNTAQAEKTLSATEQAIITTKLQAVAAEFALLYRAYQKLQRGEDAYQLLSQKPFYPELENAFGSFDSYVSKEDRQAYGPPRHPIDLVRKTWQVRDKGYQRSREKYYIGEQKKAFNQRLDFFLQQVITALPIPQDYSPIGFQSQSAEIRSAFSEGEAVYTQLADSLEKVSTAYQVEWHNVKIHESYATEIKLWKEKHQLELAAITSFHEWSEPSGDELLTAELATSDRQLAEKNQRLEQLSTYPEQLRILMTKVAVHDLQDHINKFASAYSIIHVGDGEFASLVGSGTIPAEAIQLFHHLTDLWNQTKQLVAASQTTVGEADFRWLTDRLGECQTGLDNFKYRLEQAHKINSEYPTSTDLLWHVGNFDVFTQQIMGSGMLASRNYQLDHFGQATFNSAGIIKMTKDAITIRDYAGQPETLTWEQYEKRSGQGGTGKDPYQEAHQLCFTRNYPYGYEQGIAFIFSEPDLFSKSQFMSADGYHLFDPDFKTGRPDSPGFHVDLRSEHFVVAVVEERRTDFLNYVRGEMAASTTWKDTIADIDTWIDSHVVFVDRLQNVTEVNAAAHALLQKQGQLPIPSGYFLPTGERGETASRSQQELFAYRSDQQLQKEQSEKKTPNYEEIQKMIEADDFTATAVITALKVDDELGELFSADAGVAERYAIERHTLMLLQQFEFFFAEKIPPKTRAFFRSLFLLHDIGKPLSVQETGNVTHQHEYTIPILNDTLIKLGYDQPAVQLADGIVNQDFLGNYMKPWGDLNEAVAAITNRAGELELPVKVYFELIKMFYQCDAGAYTTDAIRRNTNQPTSKTGILDYLFDFNQTDRKINFSSQPVNQAPFMGISPAEHFHKLEEAINQLGANITTPSPVS